MNNPWVEYTGLIMSPALDLEKFVQGHSVSKYDEKVDEVRADEIKATAFLANPLRPTLEALQGKTPLQCTKTRALWKSTLRRSHATRVF